MGSTPSPKPGEDRARRVQGVLQDVLRRRQAGHTVPDEQVLAAHPDLLPELGSALARLVAPDVTAVVPRPDPKRAAAPSAEAPRIDPGSLGGLAYAARSGAHGVAPPGDATPEGRPGGTEVRSSSAADMTLALPASSRSRPTTPTAREAGGIAENLRHLLPGYELLHEISRGGQGVVYLGLEQGAKRRVAIKLLLSGAAASDIMRRRFEREIELVAQLKHPNIISIYHSGQTGDGRQFYVMDYVDGVPLDRYVRERQLGLNTTLSLLIDVCEGIQYAHQRGMIHRDLKPGNILVEHPPEDVRPHSARPGEARAELHGSGQGASGNEDSGDWDGESLRPVPRILDFGLAKMLDAPKDAPVSISQEVVGTLPFMSPEQATGRHEAVDTRTDVYALGVVAYYVLTGDYPYPVVGGLLDVVRNITETAPMPPIRKWQASTNGLRRKLSKQCPFDEDVQTIVLKALAKDPDRRYQSAGEMARDLRRYLAGEPIEARSDSGWYVFRKTVRRYRTWLSVAAAFVLLISGSAVALLFMYRQQGELLIEVKTQKDLAVKAKQTAEIAREKEKQARGLADERAEEAQRQSYLASIGAAGSAVQAGDVASASLQLESAPSGRRGWEWRHLMTQVDRSALTLAGSDAAALDVAFTSDESLVAAAYADGTVVLTDLATRRRRATIRAHEGEATSVAFSPDRKLLASGGLDGRILLSDPSTGAAVKSLAGHTSGVTRLAFHGDGAILASASRDGTVRLWSIPEGVDAGILSGHEGWVTSLDFSSNGQRLVSAGRDGKAIVWDLASRKTVLTFHGHAQPIQALAASRFGDLVASASWGMIKVWNLATGREQTTIRIGGGEVLAVAISPDGTRVAAGSGDAGLRLFDAANGFEISALRGHADRIQAVVFSPDFSWIASASSDRSVKLWDAGAAERESVPLRADGAGAAAVTEDGRLIAIAADPHDGADGRVLLFDAGSGKRLHELSAHGANLTSLSFSPDGAYLVTGASDQRVKLWSVQHVTLGSGARGIEVAAAGEQTLDSVPVCIAISPDQARLAAGLSGGRIAMLDFAGGRFEKSSELAGHEDAVVSLAFSGDGTRLASGSWDGTARVWRVSDGAEERVFRRGTSGSDSSGVLAVAFDGNGESLLIGGKRGSLVRGDLASGRAVPLSVVGTSDVAALTLTSERERMFVGLQSGAIVVVDPASGDPLLTLRGHEKPIVNLVCRRGNTRLFSTSSDGLVRAWEAIE